MQSNVARRTTDNVQSNVARRTTDNVQSRNDNGQPGVFESRGIIEGDFVAVYLDKYKHEQLPMIGQITSVHQADGDVTLNWCVGCYSGSWKICNIRGKVWSERVPVSCIISTIKLTKSMKLPSKTTRLLKEQYAKYV